MNTVGSLHSVLYLGETRFTMLRVLEGSPPTEILSNKAKIHRSTSDQRTDSYRTHDQLMRSVGSRVLARLSSTVRVNLNLTSSTEIINATVLICHQGTDSKYQRRSAVLGAHGLQLLA